MPDPEINELLSQLERQIADEDESLERAKASLEETLASLKLTPEEELALADELTQLRELARSSTEPRSRSPPSAWSAAASPRS